MKLKNIIWLIAGIAPLASCEKCEYKQTKSGIYYKKDKKGDGTKPQKGDMLMLTMRFETQDSVVLADSDSLGMPIIRPYLETLKKEQEGGLEEAIGLLEKGDYLVCKIPAKKLLGSSFEELAKEHKLEASTPLFAYLHLKDIQNPEEFQKTQQKERETMLEEMKKQDEEQLPKDLETIKSYLEAHKIKALATPSGLHYIIDKVGTGNNPKKGDTVQVKYTGRTLAGKVFDTNLREVAVANQLYNEKNPYQPLTFTIGERYIIPGFDEGIQLIKKGGKARLFIPSVLAYRGNQLTDDIGPHTNLIFEIELVGIESK